LGAWKGWQLQCGEIQPKQVHKARRKAAYIGCSEVGQTCRET
jgi:hypothetical protein